jgi:Domain of unknown function (DU1801)
MRSSASSVEDYIAALTADRQATINAVRAVLRGNLDPEIEEGMQYGMIGYRVPHRVYPAGYHVNPKEPLPFLALASQKQNLALYLMHLYADPGELKWFQSAWAKAGKKLDMGKSCLRFRKLDDLALDVLGEALRRTSAKAYVELYERNLAQARAPVSKSLAPENASKKARGTTAARKAAPARKAPGRKAPARKAPARKAPANGAR